MLIGDVVELVFDNRLTLTMQIEEICRLENLTRDEQIDDGDRATTQLMPTEDSLAATLFIALPQDETIEGRGSQQLVGLDEHVVLHIGPHAIRARVRARSLDRGADLGGPVHALPAVARGKAALLTPGTPIAVEIDHPNYRYRVQCSGGAAGVARGRLRSVK